MTTFPPAVTGQRATAAWATDIAAALAAITTSDGGLDASKLEGSIPGSVGAALATFTLPGIDRQQVYNVRGYGALGDSVQLADGAMGPGAYILTSSSAHFSSTDLGKKISVAGAGANASRTVADGQMTATSRTLQSATAAFSSPDSQQSIVVAGAGAGGADLVTQINFVINSTTVSLLVPAQTTVSGAQLTIHLPGPLATTIASYQGPTQVTLTAANASGSAVSGAAFSYATDDTAAIQAAITAAQNGGGGTVFVPQGTYLVSSTLSITKSGIILRGAGRSATVIKRADFTNAYMVHVAGATDCRIEGITFDANNATNAGPTTLHTITVEPTSHNLTITHNAFINTEGFTVWTNGGPTSRVNNLRIIGNDVTALPTAYHDLLVPVSEGGETSGNHVICQNNCGLMIYESNNHSVYGNTVITAGLGRTTAVGIWVNSCWGCSVLGNTVIVGDADYGMRISQELDNKDGNGNFIGRSVEACTILGNAFRATVNVQIIKIDSATQPVSDVIIAHNVVDTCFDFITYNSGTIQGISVFGNQIGAHRLSTLYSFGVQPTYAPVDITSPNIIGSFGLSLSQSTTLQTSGTTSDMSLLCGRQMTVRGGQSTPAGVDICAEGGAIAFKGGAGGSTIYGIMVNGGAWEFGNAQQFQIDSIGNVSWPASGILQTTGVTADLSLIGGRHTYVHAGEQAPGNLNLITAGGSIAFYGGSAGATAYGLLTGGGTWEFGNAQQFQIDAVGNLSWPGPGLLQTTGASSDFSLLSGRDLNVRSGEAGSGNLNLHANSGSIAFYTGGAAGNTIGAILTSSGAFEVGSSQQLQMDASGNLLTSGHLTAHDLTMPNAATVKTTGVTSDFTVLGGRDVDIVAGQEAQGSVNVQAKGGSIAFKGAADGSTIYAIMTNGGTWEFGSVQQLQISPTGALVTTGTLTAPAFVSNLTGGGRFSMGSGVPSKPGGQNPTAGDAFWRTDTPGVAMQNLYVCITGGGSPTWQVLL